MEISSYGIENLSLILSGVFLMIGIDLKADGLPASKYLIAFCTAILFLVIGWH